ncbi:hypothetical protein VQ056_06375 [Paenibacillus sp. JTLBN-2024]
MRFNRSSDESRIGSYRIFVVKDSKAGSFSLSDGREPVELLLYGSRQNG